MGKSEDTIISLQHVTKRFKDGFVAVEDFNLDIKRGEFVTLLGPSGCGKTTTLRMIAGFDIPSEGTILLNGQDITKLPPYKRPVNTVFQHYALFPNLDVYDNVAFGLKMKRVPKEVKGWNGKTKTKMVRLSAEEIDRRVARALEIVDMEELEDRNIASLSGGQQQRVAIARAIVNEPEVLLLDEPLSALDHKKRLDMQLELKEMHEKLGITFIYVTHDQEEALSMSNTIVVMKDGAIMQVGTPESIYNEPVNAYVADFIGESNIYNAIVSGNKEVRFLAAKWACVDDFPLGEKVDVVIRPEDVVLDEPGKGNVDGLIVSSVFKGEDYCYVVKVGRSELECRDHVARAVGTKVSARVLPENIQVMHKEITENEFRDCSIDRDGNLLIGDDALKCDLTVLLKGSVLDSDDPSIIVDQKANKKYALADAEVSAAFDFDAVSFTDDLSEEGPEATVLTSVWVGDHYQILARTAEEDDYIAVTPYQYAEGEIVKVKVDPKKIKLRLRKGLDEYECRD